MFTRSILPKPSRANTLMAVLCTLTIVGLALAAYLRLALNQHRMIVRSHDWHSSLAVAEAGIEEAMTHCTVNYRTNMTDNGWRLAGNHYWKTNVLGAGANSDGYYVVRISNVLPYEIVSQGFYPFGGDNTFVSRRVRVTTQYGGIFRGAIVVRDSIDMNGNNVLTDSYDSTDPTKSTGGLYDPLKAGDKGDVGTLNGLKNSVTLGNANIWGHIYTGPNGSVATGPNGAVGSSSWQRAGKSGIQPGWWGNDLNIDFPDVTSPISSGANPPSGSVGATNYNYILGSGNYQTSGLGGTVLVTGNAVLLVTGNITFGGSDSLRIAPGASLHLYMAGGSAVFSSIANGNSSAASFRYFGLPSNTSLKLQGGAQLISAVYAPNAAVTIVGNADVYGYIVAHSAVLTGNAAVHYDEALLNELPLNGLVINSWNEL